MIFYLRYYFDNGRRLAGSRRSVDDGEFSLQKRKPDGVSLTLVQIT
jgi:hypothetical protein